MRKESCKCHVEAQYIVFNGDRSIVRKSLMLKLLMSFLCLLILISSVSDHATEETGYEGTDKFNCVIRNMALQVGGVSDETVKYDYGFYGAQSTE
jgi:hypothetical protein